MSKKEKIFSLEETYNIYGVLQVQKGITSSEFNFWVNDTFFKAEDAVRGVLKSKKDLEEMITPFTEAKKAALLKYCKKSVTGEPAFLPSADPNVLKYDMSGNEEAFAKEVSDLKKTHAKILTTYESRLKDFEKLLQKPAPNFKPDFINNKFVPVLDIQDHRVLFPLITK